MPRALALRRPAMYSASRAHTRHLIESAIFVLDR